MTAHRPVVAIGEVLWDLLLSGPALGGAPFNVLANLARLDVPTEILSVVGNDALGRRRSPGVPPWASGVLDAVGMRYADGHVSFALDRSGAPSYTIELPAAYERATLPPEDLRRLIDADPIAVVFGTLAMRFPGPRTALDDLTRGLPSAFRIYDVNLRPGAWSKPRRRDSAMLEASVGVRGSLATTRLVGDHVVEEVECPPPWRRVAARRPRRSRAQWGQPPRSASVGETAPRC